MRYTELFEQTPANGWNKQKLKAGTALEIIQSSCTNAYEVLRTGLKAYRGSSGQTEIFRGTTGEGRRPQNSTANN